MRFLRWSVGGLFGFVTGLCIGLAVMRPTVVPDTIHFLRGLDLESGRLRAVLEKANDDSLPIVVWSEGEAVPALSAHLVSHPGHPKRIEISLDCGERY